MSISSLAMSNVNFKAYNYNNKTNNSNATGKITDMPKVKSQMKPEMMDISNINYEDIKNSMMSDSEGQKMNMQGMQGADGATPPPPPPPPPSQETDETDNTNSDLLSTLTSALDETDETETQNLINSLSDNTVSQEDLEKYDTNNDGELSKAEEAKMNADKNAQDTISSYINNAINTYTSMSNQLDTTTTSLMSSISA